MKTALEIIFLLVGFVLLIKGADYFIDGSSVVAKKLKVPSIVIGLTIVAIGTSLPELAVSSLASAQGENEIALSNVIGSNIFNLLMVLGVTAFFISIPVKKSILKREMPFLLIITLITAFFAGDALWFGNVIGKINILDFQNGNETIGTVSRIDGAVLILLFAGFIIWTVRYALAERKKCEDSNEVIEIISNGKCAAYIFGGILAIVVGGQLVVESARHLALAAGMSETLVGLTVVAFGTSLPELVTSAVAGKKGEADIAVGNVVGSNIANILLVLGMSAVISPVTISMMSIIDTVISLFVTVAVFVVAKTQQKIEKKEGIFLVFIYILFVLYIISRQVYG